MTGIVDMVRGLAPLGLRALRAGNLIRPHVELVEPDEDVDCGWGVRIPVRDGFEVTANIFRSKRAMAAGERMPVIMCAHPYDNRNVAALGNTPLNGAPVQYRMIPQVGRPRFSSLTSWESPDPNFWVSKGYALVNLNLPGYGGSEGRPSVFRPSQSAAFFDAIEWVADQSWSTGGVGLSGVSFLAISQYYVAACAAREGRAPKGLKAISPWEGLTDIARDLVLQGGVAERGFTAFWWNLEIQPSLSGTAQDFLDVEGSSPVTWSEDHPVMDDFWREKLPPLDDIEVPMLACASFSDHGLHTDGTIRAFERVRGPKWLYTHRTGKWASYYSDDAKALMLQFFDCFVKGDTANGFLDRAPVRLEVRSSRDVIHEVREEHEWPLARTTWKKLYLDGATAALTEAPSTQHSVKQHARRGVAVFDYRFEQDTEVTGPMALEIDLEIRADRPWSTPRDAVIFATVEKFDRNGTRVAFYGSVGIDDDAVTHGCIAASARELDPQASKPWQPVVGLERRLPPKPGEVFHLSVALSPSSTMFFSGERLRLLVSGRPKTISPPYRKDYSANVGQHVLHLGGSSAAHLLVPIIS